MQRSPFLAAQIGLDIARWQDVWAAVEYVESSTEQQHLLANPPLSDRAPRGNRAPAFKTAPLPLWQQTRARRITRAEYDAEIRWHEWAAKNAPTHCDFTYRKPVDRKAMPAPGFGVVA
jgi:hypothetical protein